MRLHPRANPIQRFHVVLLVSCTFARWIYTVGRERERRERNWILSDNDAFVHYNCRKRLVLLCNYTLFDDERVSFSLLAFKCKNSECIWDLKSLCWELLSRILFFLSGRITSDWEQGEEIRLRNTFDRFSMIRRIRMRVWTFNQYF